MDVVKLTERGVHRVMQGRAGMTFPVDKYTTTKSGNGLVAHVRDYRFPHGASPYCIWSLSLGEYHILADFKTKEVE